MSASRPSAGRDTLAGVSSPRQCCRPGCSRLAVATLTFVYAESTAVIGPLAGADEPHSWDLCAEHAARITVPRGWEMLRSERGFSEPAEDQELTALAEAVREVGGVTARPRPQFTSRTEPARFDSESAAHGRHRAGELDGRRGAAPSDRGAEAALSRLRQNQAPRPGRRGHLRVLPDPID